MPDRTEPPQRPVADGITMLDTGLAGAPEVNAVYVVEGRAPALVETGPPADLDAVLAGLERAGLGAGDLAHIVVTHIHLDHAGAAGHLTARFPRATVWAHERGAPHLVDPTRLVASTARTYGPERMRALFGEPVPVDAARVRSVTDGDTIDLGDRRLRILYTPGHASHHVAIEDGGSGAVFTGEAIGGHVPWAHCYRPSLPPPEVDIEAGLASIERIRATAATLLLTSHFGPVPTEEGCERGAERIRSWAEAVRAVLATDADADDARIEARLRSQAEHDLEHDAGRPPQPGDVERYNVLGSIHMNAQGLARYWRKRWEAERTEGGEAASENRLS